MKHRTARLLLCLLTVMLLMSAMVVPAFAAGNVAGAIENTWNTAKTQVQSVVNNVVFPVIDMILAIMFFVKVGISLLLPLMATSTLRSFFTASNPTATGLRLSVPFVCSII